MPTSRTSRETYSHVTRRMRWSRIATFFAFFQMGAVMLMWSTSTTSLRNHLGWEGDGGDVSFGSLATAVGIGYAIGCAISGPMIDRWGCRNVAIPTLVIYPLLYLPLTLIGPMAGLIVTGVLIGLMRGFVDIVANVNGVQVERYYERPIMSAFHAAYPAGGFIFGFIGSALARGFTDSPLVPYLAIGIPLSILGYFFGRLYLSNEEYLKVAETTPVTAKCETPASSTATRIGLFLVIGLGVLAFVSYLAESAANDWGQEYVVRSLNTTAGTGAMALTVFSGAQFAGRAMGDRLTKRLGQRTVMAGSGVIGTIGAGLMLTASVPAQALIGFGFLGLGISCIVPLMLSAAGRTDPENAGRNIGLVNAIGTTGMFVGPALITTVVSGLGIGWMPVLPLVLLAAIAIAGPLLMRKAPTFVRQSSEGAVPEAVDVTDMKHEENLAAVPRS